MPGFVWITSGRSALVKPAPLEDFEIELPAGLSEWTPELRALVEAAYQAGQRDGIRQGAHQKLMDIKAVLNI